MKRSILTTIATVALALFACGEATAQTEVSIQSGAIDGMVEGEVISWKGIPFAAPPVGDLRWRAPQPAVQWEGVRQTTEYGHDCMQLPFPSDAAPLGNTPSEDCLYVNVWKPAPADGPLPVIFWIYGGGFVNGGTSPPTYSGAELAKKGVLVVSANYRLGRFGTFAHPQLTEIDADSGLLGNYALLDQIAALKWVQDNVAAFGGDPGNVTIVGESAGGFAVQALMTSPMARDLYARAVIMSGGDGSAPPVTRSDTERAGLAFAAYRGIAADDPEALAKLRALDADAITDGLNIDTMFDQYEAGRLAPGFPDGRVLVDTGQAFAEGAFAHVPVMVGATADDIGGKTGEMVAGARSFSAMLAEQGVPVYAYRFSYVPESLPGEGAWHATDIPFFFDTQAIKYGPATTKRDNAMGRTISAYLVNFARSGNPNGTGLPNWPRYEKSSDVIMDFTATGTAMPQTDPLGEILDAIARR